MLRILEEIFKSYDDLISKRLSQTKIYPSKARKGLGRHISKGDPEGRFCRGRKIRKRGYRKEPRHISTVFGMLKLRVRVAECFRRVSYLQKKGRTDGSGFRLIGNWRICLERYERINMLKPLV